MATGRSRYSLQALTLTCKKVALSGPAATGHHQKDDGDGISET